MIRLYIADVRGLDIEATLPQVSEARRQKVEHLKGYDEKRRSLGAELLLHRAFGSDFEYAYSSLGKPFAEGAFFSLSHSGNYALCAVGDAELGADIEAPRENILPLAKRFFSLEEYKKIAESENPQEAFCTLWVLKEACIKCDGAGLRILSETDISDYYTRHLAFEGYHIGIASKTAFDSVELYIEKI